jgi:predicted dehydrogenase
MLGIGIVGCGMISRFHVRALNDIPGTLVAAVFDAIPASSAKLQKEVKEQWNIDCDVAADLDALVKHKGVHIVIITTPSGNHMEPAVAAANAGKHVVVEKPMEITLERCDKIIDACDKNKVKLCTIFPSRFGDANVELKKAITAGRFGRLTLGETACKWWREQSYYDQGGWRGTWALDGGSRMNASRSRTRASPPCASRAARSASSRPPRASGPAIPRRSRFTATKVPPSSSRTIS